MVTIINALTFTTGGILGLLIGYMIEHRLARSRGIEAIRIVEFNKAASAFRAVFVDEVIYLRDAIESSDADKQGNFFVNEYHNSVILRDREKAKILFEPYVSDLKGFNAAWYAYSHGGKYSATEQDPYKHTMILRDHLFVLLKYADPK